MYKIFIKKKTNFEKSTPRYSIKKIRQSNHTVVKVPQKKSSPTKGEDLGGVIEEDFLISKS